MTKEFVVGDYVYAKVRGYPPWPAQIRGIVDNDPIKRTSRRRFEIFFYGTFERALCSEKWIFPYSSPNESRISVPNKFQKRYNLALSHIQDDMVGKYHETPVSIKGFREKSPPKWKKRKIQRKIQRKIHRKKNEISDKIKSENPLNDLKKLVVSIPRIDEVYPCLKLLTDPCKEVSNEVTPVISSEIQSIAHLRLAKKNLELKNLLYDALKSPATSLTKIREILNIGNGIRSHEEAKLPCSRWSNNTKNQSQVVGKLPNDYLHCSFTMEDIFGRSGVGLGTGPAKATSEALSNVTPDETLLDAISENFHKANGLLDDDVNETASLASFSSETADQNLGINSNDAVSSKPHRLTNRRLSPSMLQKRRKNRSFRNKLAEKNVKKKPAFSTATAPKQSIKKYTVLNLLPGLESKMTWLAQKHMNEAIDRVTRGLLDEESGEKNI